MIFFYLLIVGLFGGFAPKIEKSIDIGTDSFLFSPAACLISPTRSALLSPWWIFPSKPSRSGITLLDFLGGDSTVGPLSGLPSEALELRDSHLGAGLGSLRGSVGKGADEKYLNRETEMIEDLIMAVDNPTKQLKSNTCDLMPAQQIF